MANKNKEPMKHCIIHDKSIPDEGGEHLVSPESFESWLTLLEAAKVRGHTPIIETTKLLKENEIPNIFYHRRCRSVFTMRRSLEALKRKARESSPDSFDSHSAMKKSCRRSSSTESRVYNPICIFCDKDKFQKGSKTREKLTKAVQLRADQTLRKCAIQRGDDKIIAITSRDIVAAEAHYHVSCYKNYTRDVAKTPGSEKEIGTAKDNQTDKSSHLNQVVDNAFENLFQYIRSDIIPNKKIVPVTSLTEKLESFIPDGVAQIPKSTRKHIRRTLETVLKDSVHIFQDDKGKLLLVPDSVTLEDVVLENQVLQRELKVWKSKSTNFEKLVDQASNVIRSDIREKLKSTPWPYHPSDIQDAGHMILPNHLERFMVGLLTGDPDIKNVTQKTTTLVQSISQDIIYAVTCAKHKPPKHIILPYAVKALTGNVEIIKTLNNLGHGVSYSQLEENDTALCLQKLAASNNQKVALPASVKPYIFTNLAWDNIDRLEETLTGRGTSHRVNGIVVQARVFGPELPKNELPRIDKAKLRSLDIDHQELEVYVPGKRVGPQPLFTKETCLQEEKKAAQDSSIKNLMWIIARQVNSETQTIPSWTGFNIRTRDQLHVSEDIVEYLPTINAPATEMNTVYEIIKQSEVIRKELCLQTIVVVMDQALYAKAMEIIWKHQQNFPNILLRMGTFHTICNSLSILGKRFGDAGLKDICLEAGLVGEGSIKGVIDGKHYNRAIRVHKYIYEALMRLAWQRFPSWVEENAPEKSAVVNSFVEKIRSMILELNQAQLCNILEGTLLTELITLWQKFLDFLRVSNGELSQFWMSYIDIIEVVVLSLVRASREGNWDLHVNAIRSLIPWCFAYDKVNYMLFDKTPFSFSLLMVL